MVLLTRQSKLISRNPQKPNNTGMVARASNFAAEGQGWLCAQYVVAYSCFLVGACISGMLINVRASGDRGLG